MRGKEERTEYIYINKEPKPEKKQKANKPSNISKDPLQWTLGTATGIIGGVGATLQRWYAKSEEFIAEPGQFFKKQFWKDARYNIKKAPKNIRKMLTSGFRKDNKYETRKMQKSYTKGRWPVATKNDSWLKKGLKRTGRFIAKSWKIPARVNQTVRNAVGDTFAGLGNTKWSLNPKKWFKGRSKKFDYSRTKRAAKLAFSRDGKGKEIKEGKIITMQPVDQWEKKAA